MPGAKVLTPATEHRIDVRDDAAEVRVRFFIYGALSMIALAAVAAIVFTYVDKKAFDARMREAEQEWPNA